MWLLALSFLKVVKLPKTHHNLAFIKLKKEYKLLYVCKYFNHDAPAEDKVEIVFLRKEKQQFRNFVFCLNLGWRDYCFNFYGISLVNFFYLKYLRLNNVRLMFNNGHLKFVFVFSIRGYRGLVLFWSSFSLWYFHLYS